MGMWGIEPWDNDEAADWYGDLMESCGIRQKWLEGVRASIKNESGTVRAAVGLFVMLGRVHIWPIETYDQDLELAISRCEALLKVDEHEKSEELTEQINLELAELISRRKPADGAPVRPPAKKNWWQFWK